MLTRREWISVTAAPPVRSRSIADCRRSRRTAAATHHPANPLLGERLPIVGLGSSATFAQTARGEDATRCATSSRRWSNSAAPSSTRRRARSLRGSRRANRRARERDAALLGDEAQRRAGEEERPMRQPRKRIET